MEKVTPVILTAKELEVHYGEQIILDKASLSVHEGDRIGLVGRNGAGKSTFLKIISGIIPPDSGGVAQRKDLVISFLSQEFTLKEGKTVYENVLDGAKDILYLLKEYETFPLIIPENTSSKIKFYTPKVGNSKEKSVFSLVRFMPLLLIGLSAPFLEVKKEELHCAVPSFLIPIS